MGFRINKLYFNSGKLKSDVINLIDRDERKSNNHVTLLIGNNGTGKSRILGAIAKEFRNGDPKMFYGGIEMTKPPSRTVAISCSISDKFPTDQSYRWKDQISRPRRFTELPYVYLGTRNKVYSHSSRTLIYRSLNILLENYAESSHAKAYRKIFKYLEYEPVIKIEYRFLNTDFIQLQKSTSRKTLLGLINSKTSGGRFNSSMIRNFEVEYKEILPKVQSFLRQKAKETPNNNILINFSKSNISRIRESDTFDYEEGIETFKIINLLNRIGLVESLDIKVYKKNGAEFYFNEASSGEAQILSTMIGLIPLVKDGSLILIDEPEISLHPSWQFKYVELLCSVIDHVKGCHVIIATHSHFLVSDLPKNNSTVVILENKKGKIKSTTLNGTTFGQPAEEVLLNVFNLPSTRNYYLSRLVAEALEMLGDNERSNKKYLNIRKKLVDIYPIMKSSDPLRTVVEIIVKNKIND